MNLCDGCLHWRLKMHCSMECSRNSMDGYTTCLIQCSACRPSVTFSNLDLIALLILVLFPTSKIPPFGSNAFPPAPSSATKTSLTLTFSTLDGNAPNGMYLFFLFWANFQKICIILWWKPGQFAPKSAVAQALPGEHRKSWREEQLTRRPSGSLHTPRFRRRLQSGASAQCGCSQTSVAPRTRPVSPPAR